MDAAEVIAQYVRDQVAGVRTLDIGTVSSVSGSLVSVKVKHMVSGRVMEYVEVPVLPYGTGAGRLSAAPLPRVRCCCSTGPGHISGSGRTGHWRLVQLRWILSGWEVRECCRWFVRGIWRRFCRVRMSMMAERMLSALRERFSMHLSGLQGSG